MFSYVIDMARVNSSTTFSLQKKYDPCKKDSFEYCYTCETKDIVCDRKKACKGHVCISNLAGVGHKLKKNQMYRVKTLCRIC